MRREGIDRGLQIIPTMPIDELIATVKAAEGMGYTHCMVADEGLMHDVYAVLGLGTPRSRSTDGPRICHARHGLPTRATDRMNAVTTNLYWKGPAMRSIDS